MNKWTYKVTSVSLKLFGLFPLIRVVGTHLWGCGRSCYFHDFITHETPVKLYSKSHFHRHGTSWAEPEGKVTSRGYCSTSLFGLRCFVFIVMWLSWFSLNLLCLTELLERRKAEHGGSSHLLARVVYSQLFVGSTIHFAISPPSPNTLSIPRCLGSRKAWCFIQSWLMHGEYNGRLHSWNSRTTSAQRRSPPVSSSSLLWNQQRALPFLCFH